MRSRLNTTTWPGRDSENLKLLAEMAPENPHIIEIGPGGVIRGWGKLMRRGTWTRKFVKPIETYARRLSFVPLESYEPVEIIHEFHSKHPRLTILEVEKRVVEAVCKLNIPNCQVLQVSIEDEPVADQADALVCNHVINDPRKQRVDDMIKNIVASIKIGGHALIRTKFTDLLRGRTDLEEPHEYIFKRIA